MRRRDWPLGSRRLAALLLVLSLALGAAGCARPIVVSASTLYPARVPVRAFPSIWIAGNTLPQGDLRERLRAHLARSGQHELRVLDVQELEPLREADQISPLTLVVLIEAEIEADVQSHWDVVPVQYCDFYWGCYTNFQSVHGISRQVFGDVALTVYEGPTARPLQSERFQAVVAGRDTLETRQEVFEQLAQQLTRAVDLLRSELRIELEPVDEPPTAARALALLRKGEWEEGRALLEQAIQQLGGKSRDVQARVWYDLAMARWQAPGHDGFTQQAYEAARKALEQAIALDQTPRYRTALERLELARERAHVIEEQRRVSTQNFSLKGEMPESQ